MTRRSISSFARTLSVLMLLMAFMALSAGAVSAGEVTGNDGTTPIRTQANSICAFSGLNDDPTGEDPQNGPPGRTQTFGQDVSGGFIDPAQFNPGNPMFGCRGGSNPFREP